MSKLLGILSAQHRAIEQRARSIGDAVQARDAVRIYVELPTLRSTLAAHLRLEATELYPKLLELAEASGDLHLARVGREFSVGVTSLGEGVDRFVERYSTRQIDLELFGLDWAAVWEKLSARLRAEEERLYAAFTQASGRHLSGLGFARPG